MTLEGEGADELPRSAEHLALRAFALVAPVEGHSFRFVNRIPLERGLGSSAATIAAGLVAGLAVAGRDASPDEVLALGLPLEGHADNLAPAVFGGVCLSWRNGTGADAHAPARDRPAARADRRRAGHAREHRGLARRACPRPSRTPTPPPRARRPRCSARRSPPATPSCSRPRSTTSCTSRYRVEDAPLLAELRDDPVPGTAGVTLSGSGPSVVVWAAKADAAAVAAALAARVCPTPGPAPSHRRPRSRRRMSVYAQPSDPAKRSSAALTDGVDRAGARAMMKAVGFTDEDLAKPLVGVATCWIETMPCNLNQRELAVHVKEGIRAAGGTPIEFNTISVSDGVSMGTTGMRASLISREVIADSIELVCAGHLLRRPRLPRRLRQDAARRRDGARAARHPGARSSTTARSRPAASDGHDVTIQDVFEAIGARAAGKMTDEDVHELESCACPGAGACGGQFTANTMALVIDFLGISPRGLSGIPATHPDKASGRRSRRGRW